MKSVLLNKQKNPTYFESYGRQQTTRSAEINQTLNNSLSGNPSCNCSNGNYNMNDYPTNGDNNMNNTFSNCNCNSAVYLKYCNLRIKYVGFIYDNVNYIVDLDNRCVLYKPKLESCWRHYNTKVSISSNDQLKSYQLSFKLIGNKDVATCEVYPNDINSCSVDITNIRSHKKQTLSNDYINYEFYSKRNMLDSRGNIITYNNYSKVFKLTQTELMKLFTHGESAELIHNLLEVLNLTKDTNITVDELLTTVRDKMNNNDYSGGIDDIINGGNNNSCGCGNSSCKCTSIKNNESNDNSSSDNTNIDKPSDDNTNNGCNCGCGNTPFEPIPKDVLYEVEKEDIVGFYRSEMNDSIRFLDTNTVVMDRYKDEELSWYPYYIVDKSGDAIALIIRIELNDGISYLDFEYNPVVNELKEVNKRLNVYKRTKSGEVNFNLNAVFVFTRNDGYETEKTIKLFKNGMILGNSPEEQNEETYDSFYNVLINEDIERAEIYFMGELKDTFVQGLELSLESLSGYKFKYIISGDCINSKRFVVSREQIEKGALDIALVRVNYTDEELKNVMRRVMIEFKKAGSDNLPDDGNIEGDENILTKIIPLGGKKGDVLVKASNQNLDLKWDSVNVDYIDNNDINGIFDNETSNNDNPTTTE